MWLLVCIGVVIIVANVSIRDFIIEPHPILYVASGITLAYWLYFFMKGVTSNLQASFRPHHIEKLVTHGVYARVRHPIYSADIVLTWGIFLMFPSAGVALCALWTTAVLVTWVYLEEKALLEIFKEEYSEYQKRVPMLFPLKKI